MTNRSVGRVPNSRIEFFAVQNQRVVIRLNYSALGGNRTRRVDVVTGHHANSDAR